MADTTTTNLGLTKPEVGASAGRNLWGGKINSNLDALDAVFAAAGNGTSVGLNVGAGKTFTCAGTLAYNGNTLTGTTGTGNMVLSASPALTGKLYVDGLAAGGYADWSQLQLQLRGTNTNQRFTAGYDTTNEVGVIQVGKNGTGWMPLWLNPAGGYVYVTETFGVRRTAGTYGVDITVNNATGNTTIAPTGSGATLTIPDLTISGRLTGIGSNSVLTYLSSGVSMPSQNTWYTGPNTGTIGSAGQTQTWLVVASGSVTAGGQAYGEIQLYDGTTQYSAQGMVFTYSDWYANGTAAAVVTFTGTKTFYLRAACNIANGTLRATSGYGVSGATYIYAVRLA